MHPLTKVDYPRKTILLLEYLVQVCTTLNFSSGFDAISQCLASEPFGCKHAYLIKGSSVVEICCCSLQILEKAHPTIMEVSCFGGL